MNCEQFWECKQCKNERMNRYLESWESSRTKPPVEKQCKQCKNVKSISEFCKDRYYKDGYHHICKSCQSKRQKEMKTRWEKERKQQSKKIVLILKMDLIASVKHVKHREKKNIKKDGRNNDFRNQILSKKKNALLAIGSYHYLSFMKVIVIRTD